MGYEGSEQRSLLYGREAPFLAKITTKQLDTSLFVVSFTGTLTLESKDVLSASTTKGLAPGQVVSHALLPGGTTIVSISGTTVTLSNAATGNNGSASLTAAYYLYAF